MQLRPSHALLLLALAGCSPDGGAAPVPIPVEAPEDALDPAPWELRFPESELVRHREGRVVSMGGDDEGEPLAGARVELLAPSPDGHAPPVVVASVETGADGGFRVGPGVANHWILRVSRADRVTTVGGRNARFAGLVPLPPDGPLTITLRRSVARAGRLLDRDGEPLPDEPLLAFGEAYHEEARTDADGRFVIHPPAETIVLEPRGEAWLADQTRVDAARDAELELRARPRDAVRGVVIESETERPLAGACVVWDGAPHVRTRTDAGGRFEIAEPRERPAGAFPEGRLAAFASGWGWRSVALPAAGDVEIRLQRGMRAAGRVLRAGGEPVAGARVLALSATWDRQVELVRGPLTDAGGAFELDWLPRPPRGERDPVVLVARGPGAGTSDGVAPTAGGAPVELVLPGERVVVGRLVRESGEGIGEVPLEARWSVAGLSPIAASRLPYPTLVEGWARADGTFEMHGVTRARDVLLRVVVEGGFIEKTLAPGDVQEVELLLEGAGALEGRIVDREGELLDVTGSVTARALDHPVFTNIERHADIDGGAFRFADLPDAAYDVTATIAGHIVRSQRARAGDADLRLVAERIARLVVKPVFPAGAEPEPIVVRYARDGPGSTSRRIEVPAWAGSGARDVQAGVFDIEASGGVWRGSLQDVRVEPGEERVVEIVLERTLRTRARLLEADGSPIAGGRVRLVLLGASGRRPEIHYSDRDGWVELTGLTPGEWEASVVMANRAPLGRVLHVEDEAPDELELRLPPHGELRLRVLTSAGEPAANALLALANEDGTPVQAWGEGARQLGSLFRSGEDGVALVRGVRAGPIVVTARQRNRRLGRVEALVVGGETTEITLRQR